MLKHTYHPVACKQHLQILLINYANTILGFLHRVYMDDLTEISEEHATSIFRIEMCRWVKWMKHVPLKRRQHCLYTYGVKTEETE
jgi:hypothetical protein